MKRGKDALGAGGNQRSEGMKTDPPTNPDQKEPSMNDATAPLSWCKDFHAAYSKNRDLSEAPGWPIDMLPDWAQYAKIHVGTYPRIVVELERHVPGQRVSVTITRSLFIDVAGTDAGKIGGDEVVIYIDAIDDRHGDGAFDPDTAIEVAELLTGARDYITAATS